MIDSNVHIQANSHPPNLRPFHIAHCQIFLIYAAEPPPRPEGGGPYPDAFYLLWKRGVDL